MTQKDRIILIEPMNTYTDEEVLKLGPIIDSFILSGQEYYTDLLKKITKEESSQKEIILTFLAGYLGGWGEDVLQWVYELPFNKVPLLLAESIEEDHLLKKVIAIWRLKLEK